MQKGIYTVTENIQLTPSTWRMKLAGDVSAITAPGQFINIKLDEHFLRRPISVCDVEPFAGNGNASTCAGSNASLSGAGDALGGAVTIIYKVLGQGTDEMTRLAPGASLDVLTGLGNGYDLSDAGDRPLLIGGGVGIPPLYLAAKQLMQAAGMSPETKEELRLSDKAGKSVSVILGFNTAGEIYYVDEFKSHGCEVYVATADGSTGTKGYVTDAFENLISSGQSFTHFYTCGPGPMLKAVYKKVYEDAGISGQMSFEERMGCGFGACMGCSIRTKSGNKRICKDGPVLRTEEILW